MALIHTKSFSIRSFGEKAPRIIEGCRWIPLSLGFDQYIDPTDWIIYMKMYNNYVKIEKSKIMVEHTVDMFGTFDCIRTNQDFKGSKEGLDFLSKFKPNGWKESSTRLKLAMMHMRLKKHKPKLSDIFNIRS